MKIKILFFEINFDIFTAIIQMSATIVQTIDQTVFKILFLAKNSIKFPLNFHRIISLKGHKGLHGPYSKSYTPRFLDFAA